MSYKDQLKHTMKTTNPHGNKQSETVRHGGEPLGEAPGTLRRRKERCQKPCAPPTLSSIIDKVSQAMPESNTQT